MKKKQMLLGAAILLASNMYGQQKDSAQTTTLDEVIVTANKLQQKQSNTGKVITVISKSLIEKSAGKTVSQLLNEQAGIMVNGALNNLGSNQTLYVRGANSGRTLVLIDGVPVSDPSLINSDFDLNLISVNDVERIEICKGAQSTLYGSDAIAGVINIITQKNNITKPFNVNASILAGNLNTIKANLQVFGKTDGLTYSAKYAKIKTDGFSAANDKNKTGKFDNDGYNNDAISGFLKYEFSKHFFAKTFLNYSQYKTDLDAGPYRDDLDFASKNKSLMAGIGMGYKSTAVSITANYQYNDITRNLLDDSTHNFGYLSRNDYYGKSQFAELFANITLCKSVSLLTGVDYRNNKMNFTSFGAYPASQYGPGGTYGSHMDSGINQSSIYTSLLFHNANEKLHIDLGGRLNFNSKFGNNGSYSFNPSYQINNNVRLLGSISTAYKTPTIYELYSDYGNKNLQTENSTSYELGLQIEVKNISQRLVYFYRNIDNSIDFNYLTYQYFNINKQTANGLEYEVKANLVKGFSIFGNYTFLSGSEQSQSRINYHDTTYNYLLKRPKHSINLNVNYQINTNFFASIGVKYASKKYDVGGYQVADVTLDSYLIFNAHTEYKINSNLKFFAEAQNLFNKKFYEINGYNSIPFLVSAGVLVHL